MKKLVIVRAKPNPAGKDKSNGRPLAEQLLGEWVDIRNESSASVSFANVSLDHTKFEAGCSNPRYSPHWAANPPFLLDSGAVLRVHTGKEADRALMKIEDREGAALHVFANSGLFVLNNDCGDTLTLWLLEDGNWKKLDQAGYDPRPPEGAVLYRVGDKLQPVAVRTL